MFDKGTNMWKRDRVVPLRKQIILLVNLEFVSGSLANELGKQRRDEVVELEEGHDWRPNEQAHPAADVCCV